MKTIKKLMTLVLSIAMVLALGATAFAAENSVSTYSITIENAAADHIYEAYQILAGDLTVDASNKKVLSNLAWGSSVTDKGKAELGDVKNQTLTNSADAAAFAKRVANYLSAPVNKSGKQSNGKYTISNLPAGYYLVKDQDNTLTNKNDFYTAYIMEVVGDVTANPKGDKPSFEKKIKDANDTTGVTSDWQDSADYDIGDKIPFKLEGTVAANYADYKTYRFVFHDKEEIGLTFNADTVEVYVDNNENGQLRSEEISKDKYEVKEKVEHVKKDGTTETHTFDVIFDNLKSITSVKAGSKIRVEYMSTLNDKAVLGKQGNVNSAKLEFSNNPNVDQGGSTGETPWDDVIVFTYQVVVNKHKNSLEGELLPGAEFTLSKKLSNELTKDIAVVKSSDGTSFTFRGLDDGDYILTETVTPSGYNTIDPITFTVTATHEIVWAADKGRTEILTGLTTGDIATGNISFVASDDKGTLTTNVVNKQGSTLPSTGGMGTTIFYVVGTILVLAAVVLLITKKRMHADK